jgi:DNA-binding NarL/FixJ family response regulator
MIRVVVADDQAVVRGGICALVNSEEDLTVVGEAGDGHEVVAVTRRHRPDVVLMDIRMPEVDGIAATRIIAGDQDLDGVHVVILTTFDLDEYIFEGLRAGAAGFLVKDSSADELLQAVRVVAYGNALLSPTVTRRLIAEYASRSRRPSASNDFARLTDRERQVVQLIVSGLSNEEIASEIYTSLSTVKTHVARAMTKLGARDRAQLVIFAYEAGFVRPGWSA